MMWPRLGLLVLILLTGACAKTPKAGDPVVQAERVPKAKRININFTVNLAKECVRNDPGSQTLRPKQNQGKLYWEISNECDVPVVVELKDFIPEQLQTSLDPFDDDTDDGAEGRRVRVNPGKVRQIHVDTKTSSGHPDVKGRTTYTYTVAVTFPGAAAEADPEVIIEW